MKTAYPGLIGIALVVSLFFGCSPKPDTNPSSVDPAGVTITYWYQHSQVREEALKTLISRFNSENPWKITVKGEYAGNYPDIFNKMSAGIAGGVTPDLVVAYQNDASSYRQANAIVDLNPYLNDPKYGISATELSDFFPDFLAQDVSVQFGGERLGWPPNRSVEVLYYNADWLKSLGFTKPPKNWQEFAAMCKKATDPKKGSVGYEIKTDASTLFGEVISRGGDFLTTDGKGYQLDSAEIKASMSYMQKLFRDGYARKIPSPFADQADFANGKVLFVLDSTSGLPYYDRSIKGNQQKGFSWGVAAVPHETSEPILDVYGASVSVVKSSPQKQLASWIFLRWMSQPQQQAEWVRASNYFPVRKSTYGDLADYLKTNTVFAQASGLLNTSRQMHEPSFAGYEQVRDAIATAFNAVLDGADLESTLANLQKKAEKLLKQSS